jgi:carboxyl-terminal processing protease
MGYGRVGFSRIGYLRVKEFGESSSALLRNELARMEKERCTGYVIDLRNNPGGYLVEAMTSSSLFLPDPHTVVAYTLDAAGFLTVHDVDWIHNEVVHQHQRDEPDTKDRAGVARAGRGAPTRAVRDADRLPSEAGRVGTSVVVPTHKPMVVLVDRGTASAAEMLAAALHDNDRAVLMGEHTYGKGLIQRVFPLPNGGALKLTIGEYVRPSKARVQRGVGLAPDRYCVDTPSASGMDACVEKAILLVNGVRTVDDEALHGDGTGGPRSWSASRAIKESSRPL